MAMDKQNELTLFQTLWGFLETGNDDLFFLLDLVTDQIRLSGRSRELYPLPQDAGGICTLKDFSRIVHPRDLPKVKELLRMMREEEIPVHELEYRLVQKNGTVVWVVSRSVCRQDESGRLRWVAGRIAAGEPTRRADYFTGSFSMERLKEEIGATLSGTANGFFLVLAWTT